MKSLLGLLPPLLLIAGVAWIAIGVRKYRARKRAEALREAAFLAELARSTAKKEKPAPAASKQTPTPASPASPAAAIKGLLAKGNAEVAARLFVQHAEQRNSLKLAPAEWEPLGRALLAQGAYMEAAWALHAGALLAGDAAAAQKRLLEIATSASAAGRPQIALRLYQTLLAKYPGSEFAEFARAGIKLEEKGLAKG